jgi:iron uptake system component EfeO
VHATRITSRRGGSHGRSTVRAAIAVVVSVPALASAGIAGAHAAEATVHQAAIHQVVQPVDVTVSDQSCRIKGTLPAGAALFDVHLTDQSTATELEVVADDGSGQVSEIEGLGPGETGSFAAGLKRGKYLVTCPGVAHDSSTLTVSGKAPAPLPRREATALDTYVQYLLAQAQELRVQTRALRDTVVQGNVEGARVAYEAARVPYGRIAPVATVIGSFANRIDGRIDGRPGDVAADALLGFHRIEQGLWQAGTTDGLTPYTDRLLADVDQLYAVIPDVRLRAADAMRGTAATLKQAGAAVADGSGEPSSHLDLVDVAALVEGARASALMVAPLLGGDDAKPVVAARRALDAADAALVVHVDGASYQPWTALSSGDRRLLGDALDHAAVAFTKARQALGSAAARG